MLVGMVGLLWSATLNAQHVSSLQDMMRQTGQHFQQMMGQEEPEKPIDYSKGIPDEHSPMAAYASQEKSLVSRSPRINVALTPEVTSLLSGMRIGEGFRGIRSAGSQIIITFTLDHLERFDENKHPGLRKLNAAETAALYRVMNEISGFINVTFVKALRPASAYVAIAGSLLDNIDGYANYPVSHNIAKIAISINRTKRCNLGSCPWAERIFRHEIGHVLGLKHPFDEPHRLDNGKIFSVMQYSPLLYFTEHDKQALVRMYGGRSSYQPKIEYFAGR